VQGTLKVVEALLLADVMRHVGDGDLRMVHKKLCGNWLEFGRWTDAWGGAVYLLAAGACLAAYLSPAGWLLQGAPGFLCLLELACRRILACGDAR